jgi:hypothetical protein
MCAAIRLRMSSLARSLSSMETPASFSHRASGPAMSASARASSASRATNFESAEQAKFRISI